MGETPLWAAIMTPEGLTWAFSSRKAQKIGPPLYQVADRLARITLTHLWGGLRSS